MRTACRSTIRNQRVRNKLQVMTTVCLILMAIFVVGCTEEDVQDSVKQQPSPAETSKPESPQGAGQESEILIVTHSKSNYISFTNPATGIVEKLEVGKSPFGLALAAQGNRAYVSTAEGVSVVDTAQRQLITTVPYLTPIPSVEYGEYRPGGMGIIVSPDDRYVYVGVYSSSRASQLEVLDTQTMDFVHKVPVGIRPFDVS
ncbi:MAG: lipoprotein, partial [Paenibacillus sp.]|nr:lipoprotein [Paenibacillus sp.]